MNNDDLAKALKAYREKQGLSGREMAAKLHMSKSAYNRLETGLTSPTYVQFQNISKLLDGEIQNSNSVEVRGRRAGIIADLKQELLYGSISTHDALKALLDLADQTGCVPLLEWVQQELDGYPDYNSEVPAYRRKLVIFQFEYQLDGDLFFTNFSADDEWDEDEKNEDEDDVEGPTSFFDYHKAINKLGDDGSTDSFGRLFTIEEEVYELLCRIVRDQYGQEAEKINGLAFIPKRNLKKVTFAVQEIILNFLTALEREFGLDASIGHLAERQFFMGRLLRKEVIAVGPASHIDLPEKPKHAGEIIPVNGDSKLFTDWLDQYETSIYEMDAFFQLDERFEVSPPPPGIVPPEVIAWANKVTISNKHFRADDKKLINGLKLYYGVKE